MPLSYRDPNTNQVVQSKRSVSIKEGIEKIGETLNVAKDLQREAIRNIDENASKNVDSEMAIMELFEGRESDKLALEEATAKAVEAQNQLAEAQKEIASLKAGQEEMMQAILEIYETGDVKQ